MIEELKMILDLLGGVQEDAYSLVVMYMGFLVVKWAVLSGAVIYFLHLTITKGAGLIQLSSLPMELKNILRPDHNESYVYSRDMSKIREACRQYKENN